MKKRYLKYVIILLVLWNTPVLLHSQCWETALNAPQVRGFWDVEFVNDSIGWAAGVNHSDGITDTTIIAKTIDGGVTWTYRYYPEYQGSELENCCRQIDFVDEEVGYGLSGMTSFFKTEDGGESWIPIDIGYESSSSIGPLTNLQFVSRDTGWVLFRDVGPFGTTDGGETWTLQSYSGGNDFEFLDSQRGWCVRILGGSSGTIFYKTTDGGANWAAVPANYDFYGSRIDFVNDTLGWAAGYSDTVYKTINGGDNWEYIGGLSTLDGFSLSGLEFANDTMGWMTSKYDSRIGITIDGGETWHLQNTPVTEDTRSLFVKNEYDVWASGDVLRRYQPELPPCESLNQYVNNLSDLNTGSLMPEITWQHPPGCIDGYTVSMTSGFDDDFATVYAYADVGFSTSYQMTTPLPSGVVVALSVMPYNYAYGTGGCTKRQLYWTITCPEVSPPIDTFICQGEDFVWDGHVFSEPGVYEIPYLDALACDSTLTLNLQWFEPPAQTIVDTLLASGDIFEGMEYVSDTIFTTLFSSANGCDSIVTYVINIVTDVDNPDEGILWQLYPNPAADEVFVAGKYGWEDAILYDLQGRVVRNWTGDNQAGRQRLDVSNLMAGMYLLRLRGEEAQVVLRLVLE